MKVGDRVRVRRHPVLFGDRVGASIGDIGVIRELVATRPALYIDFEDYNKNRDCSRGIQGYTWALQLGDVEVIEPLNSSTPSKRTEW